MRRTFFAVCTLLAAARSAEAQPPVDAGASTPLALLQRRAALELSCPVAELTFTVIADKSSENLAGKSDWKSYRVTGCGQQASYDAWCVETIGRPRDCDAVPTLSPTPLAPALAPSPAAPAAPASGRDQIQKRDGEILSGTIVDELKGGYLLRGADGATVIVAFGDVYEVKRNGRGADPPVDEAEPAPAQTGLRAPGALLDREVGHERRKMISLMGSYEYGHTALYFVNQGWGLSFPIGAALRVSLPLLPEGFLPMLNDSFDLELGLDAYDYPGAEYQYWGTRAPYTYPMIQHINIPLLGFIPIVEPRWTFYVLPRLSAYFKLCRSMSTSTTRR
jgi:hypothetical protein